MKIAVASDSFKGSLSSREIAENVAEGIHGTHPDWEVIQIEVADGGEGTVEAMIGTLGGRKITAKVNDPLMRPIEATYGIIGESEGDAVSKDVNGSDSGNEVKSRGDGECTNAVESMDGSDNKRKREECTNEDEGGNKGDGPDNKRKREECTNEDEGGNKSDGDGGGGERKSAVIEMAAASGLPLLKPGERNPLKTTTYGTGELIADAIAKGCTKIYIGIGGSATNDGGTGMLTALGYRFLDCNGRELEGCGESLEKIVTIDSSQVPDAVRRTEFIVACDVDNPFCGPNGAAYIFAPQKGADTEMVAKLDIGLQKFAEVIKTATGCNVAEMPGAGAAGGIGGAFKAFFNATLRSGADMVLDAIGFDDRIRGCDLVITGEGRIDRQTAMGKLPAAVLRHVRSANPAAKVVAICGSVACTPDELPKFDAVLNINDGADPHTLEEMMRPDIAAANVRRTAGRIALLSGKC